jgi:predicted regulator of Ras-like GTPase activity (Roadblock/LC7/MglB family)
VTNWNPEKIESAIAPEGLQVGQLIYTSFLQNGFVLLKSADVPAAVQQVFMTQHLQTLWDTYSPPKSSYRAAFLHQLSVPEPGTLFGWLYHDGQDEFRRADVPYFIAYYLHNFLQAVQLSQILTCLQQGPEEWVDRLAPPPAQLLPLRLVNTPDRKAARRGVELPAKLRVETYQSLESGTVLNWFYEAPDSLNRATPSKPPIPSLKPKSLASPQLSLGISTMNTDNLTTILKQLVAKPGIQGTALVSAEGQAIIAPIGIDENTAGILAGNMLCLLKSMQDELLWQDIEIVSVRSPKGHLILKGCGVDLYLLIKAEKVPVGLLEGEVSRAIDKLQAELNRVVIDTEAIPFAPQAEEPLPSEPLVVLASENVSKLPVLSLDAEVTYRGRRVSS